MIDAANQRAAAGRPMQDARKTQKKETAPAGEAEDKPLYYQLILANARPIDPDFPMLKQIHIQHVTARSVGEFLLNLYLPAGPSGTPERYALIYPSVQEWNMAAGAVKKLDVPAENMESGSQVTTFAQAISAYYAAVSHGADTAKWQILLDSLKHIANKADQTAWQRWAAFMLAGAIAADRVYDYSAAEQLYRSAETSAGPGSVEQMNAIYRRARVQLQSGANTNGRRLLAQIIGQFSAFRSSEVFERARQRLAEIDRGQ